MMGVEDFDQRYAGGADPWAYRTSPYERAKYAATLAACGPGPFDAALELGASIGIFSAALVPLCRQLTTVDFSANAVAQARKLLADRPGTEVVLGTVPEAIDDRPRDLVVASEILYYLQPDALHLTLERLAGVMLPGAHLVIVHWRPAGPERPFTAREVHDLTASQPWLKGIEDASTTDYLLNVLERV